jgi:hypothetical protein
MIAREGRRLLFAIMAGTGQRFMVYLLILRCGSRCLRGLALPPGVTTGCNAARPTARRKVTT